MIKLINLLELNVNNSRITPELVNNYFDHNIQYNSKEFSVGSIGLNEIEQILNNYGFNYYNDPQSDWEPFLINLQKSNKLNQFYRDLRVCVKKHVGKEIII